MDGEKVYELFVGKDLLDDDSPLFFKFEQLSEFEKRQLQKICDNRNIEYLVRPYDK